jgi:ubiquinone/menaquinone biosynthesis C-methylase UbiE
MTLGRDASLRAQTVALAAPAPGESVLEVGCGTGEIALRARAHVGASGNVMGIDPSPEMINVARRKASEAGLNIDYRTGVVEAMPYPAGSFDIVFGSLMMHHLPEDLKRTGLQEIYRVLKPQGRLVIVDLARPKGVLGKILLAASMHGGLRRGVQDLAPLVEGSGFTNIETGALNVPMLGYLRACKPM